MAIYSFRQSIISAGSGLSAVAAAAYRHSARMENDFSNRVENYSQKPGTLHSELALPADAPQWLRDEFGLAAPDGTAPRLEGPAAVSASETLWNIVEWNEKRRDAQYAAELVLALPVELTHEENIALVRAFVAESYTAKGRIADWAFHLPPGREHNPHVHILSTLRPLTDQGFGPKAVIARDAAGEPVRNARGDVVYQRWAASKPELYAARAAWADHVNEALARAGHDITVDHRSFQDRGIEAIIPTAHRGKTEHMPETGPALEVRAFDAEEQAANFAAFRQNPSLVLEQITRERSTFDTRDIARMIHRYAGRGDDFQALLHAVGALPELVAVQAEIHDPETNRVVQRERFTTLAVLEREAELRRLVGARAQDLAFATDEGRRDAAIVRSQEAQGFAYSPEQRAAIGRLTRAEGVAVMVGIAGAGKSTVLRAVGEIYRGEAVAVHGGALAGKAADNLQQSAGIASRTLASWERAWEKGFDRLEKGDVFVLDEAGMVACEQMRWMLDHLDGFGAKIVLVGDARQLQPIEAGAAFRSIADAVGYVELTEVRRQEREDHAAASVLFGAGETRSALDIYRANDSLVFHDERSAALAAAAANWRHDWRAGSDVMMLAHANKDVAALNRLAREAIQAEGGLTEDTPFLTARGQRDFAVGERVLFLENDRQLGLRNGTIGTLTEVGRDRLVAALPGRVEPVTIERERYNNLDYGYAATIHKAQGSTFDRVHVVAGGTMDAQLTYVALSRHREEVTVHLALDSFARPGRTRRATPEEALQRLATERLKDTSLDYARQPDYREALDALVARREEEAARARSFAGRFESFLEHRGLAHPAEVLQSIRDYAATVIERARPIPAAEEIRVPTGPSPEQLAAIAARGLVAGEALRPALTRLREVQSHSAAMHHEGSARRSAFFTAETVLTRSEAAPAMRDYAERVAAVLSPTVIVAIGPDLSEAREEPRLAALPDSLREALQANWRDVHAVARAAWELGLMTTLRDVDTGYRQLRADEAAERDYREGLEAPSRPAGETRGAPSADRGDARGWASEPAHATPPPAPAIPLIPAVTTWPVPLEAAVARTVLTGSRVAAFERSAQKHAARIWRDPETAWTTIRAEVLASRHDARAVLQHIRTEPQSYGELLGGRTLLRRPDAERQAALDRVSFLASSLNHFVVSIGVSEPVEREKETRWRAALAEPLPDLSPEARRLLDDLNHAHALRRPGTNETAQELTLRALADRPLFEELKAWSAKLEERLAVPKAVERIPGLSPDDRRAIGALSEAIGTARLEVRAAGSLERSRAYEREQERTYGRDRDIGYERG